MPARLLKKERPGGIHCPKAADTLFFAPVNFEERTGKFQEASELARGTFERAAHIAVSAPDSEVNSGSETSTKLSPTKTESDGNATPVLRTPRSGKRWGFLTSSLMYVF